MHFIFEYIDYLSNITKKNVKESKKKEGLTHNKRKPGGLLFCVSCSRSLTTKQEKNKIKSKTNFVYLSLHIGTNFI